MLLNKLEDIIQKISQKADAKLILAIILLTGLILRLLYMLFNRSGLFTDSAFSLYYAKFPLQELTRIIIYDPTPPLYYWFLHFIIKINDSLLFISFVHVIIGMLGIATMYYLGKSLYDKKVGIAAAFFTSISLTHIYYSNSIRHYLLWTIFISLAMLFLNEGLKNNKTKNWLSFIVAAVLAFYTNYLTIFFIAAVFLLFLIPAKMNKLSNISLKRLKICLVMVSILILPLFLIKAWTILSGSSDHMQLIGGFFQPIFLYLYLVFDGFMFNNMMEKMQSVLLELFALAIITALFLNSLLRLKNFNKNGFIVEIKNDNAIKILLFAFFVILMIFSFLSLYLIRYLLLLFPAFIIILSKGYSNINSRLFKIAIGLLLTFLVLISYPSFVENAEFKIDATTKQIMDTEQKNDLIMILPPENYWNFAYYYKGSSPIYDLYINYLDRNNKNNELEIIRIKSGGTTNKYNYITEENIENLNYITKNFDRVWLVLGQDYIKKDPNSLVEKYFYKSWNLKSDYHNDGIDLFLFEKRIQP